MIVMIGIYGIAIPQFWVQVLAGALIKKTLALNGARVFVFLEDCVKGLENNGSCEEGRPQ